MRHYTFYICIALLTFITGTFFGIKIYLKNQENKYLPSSSGFSNVFYTQSKFHFPKTVEQETQPEKPNKPFCNDKKILPVWKYLIKDKDFQEWEPYPDESLDCKDMLNIKEVDLNRDGSYEILLRGNNSNFCSAVGNCAFWIYEKKGKGYKQILYATDHSEVSDLGKQVKKNKTSGYYDILLKGHFTASDTTFSHYKFSKGKYKLAKDLIEACIICSGENPKWKMMTWKEYKKLRH